MVGLQSHDLPGDQLVEAFLQDLEQLLLSVRNAMREHLWVKLSPPDRREPKSPKFFEELPDNMSILAS